jgi:indolepyruvate ferredoxin oxidoreductase
VSAGAKTLGLTKAGRTGAIVNSHEIITGDFTRDTEFRLPTERMTLALEARLRDAVDLFDASDLAKAVLGDSIFSNMMIFGAAWQRGYIPLSHAAIVAAITLNGAAVDQNLRAFEIGRWAVLFPEDAAAILSPKVVKLPQGMAEKIEYRAAQLVGYQGKGLAKKYRAFVDAIEDEVVRDAAMQGYHKLLSYKDAYEGARLLLDTRAKAKAEFDGDFKMTFNLAPPFLSKMGANGRPLKREFGPWLERPLRILAKMKRLRGTPFDVFGYTAERKMERALIAQYETDMKAVLKVVNDQTRDAVVALAELPLQIRGFGPVKIKNEAQAAKRREELLSVIASGGAPMLKAAE